MFDLPPAPGYSTAASDERFARRLQLVVDDLADAARGIVALRVLSGWRAPSADVYADHIDHVVATVARAAGLVDEARDQATASARMQ